MDRSSALVVPGAARAPAAPLAADTIAYPAAPADAAFTGSYPSVLTTPGPNLFLDEASIANLEVSQTLSVSKVPHSVAI